MDVEDAQERCNGGHVRSNRTSNNSSLSGKVGQRSGLERFQDDEEEEETTQRIYDGNMAFGWQNSSRIVRVSRASGGKDRHSKVLTSKGLRDRRVRLSVSTAIQFYDLQDQLGVDQPSKAVDWLIKAAADSIAELPPLNTSSFLDGGVDRDAAAIMEMENGGSDQRQRKLVRACSSSTSETSKGSGLSLSRSEGRVKARERARERAAKEKEKEINPRPHNSSSFTELLTAGFNNSSSATQDSSSIFGLMGSPSPPLGQLQMPQPMEIPHFSLSGYHHHHHHQQQQQQQHFSFMPETASDSDYNNLSFSISSTSGMAASFNNSRGTLQSNFLLPQHEHNNLHRFGPLDEASNLPFLITPTTSSIVSSSMETHQHRQFPNGFDPRLHLYYDDGCRRSDHKGKGKS